MKMNTSEQSYLHSPAAAAWIPLLQALITACVLGLAALVLAAVLKWQHAGLTAGCVFVLTLAVSWIQSQRRWHAMTDLNGGKPAQAATGPAEVKIRLLSDTDNVHHETRAILPATLAQMQDLAAGLLAGRPFAMPFSERAWTGKGRPFSISEFRALRDELVKRGLLALASPKDPRQGYVLTCVGRQAMRAFLREDLPHPERPARLVQ